MSLIKTIAEIRDLIPGVSKLSDTAQLPNFSLVEYKHLVPLLGQALYDDLDTKYNATNLSPTEAKLVKYIQLPLAAYGLLDQLASRQVLLTDNGVRVPETTSMRTAYSWEFTELRNALASYAYEGTERLLDYLLAQKADFPSWTDSDGYKSLSRLVIQSGVDFSRQYPLEYPLRTFWLLRPIMEDVQEWYLVPTLGRQLTAWVVAQADGVIVTEDGQEVDIKKLVKKAVAHLVIKHAAEQLRVRFSQYGFTVLATDPNNKETAGKKAAEPTDLGSKIYAADRDGQNYLARAASYFKKVAAGEFTEDFGSDFTTAFDSGPLATVDPDAPTDKGNGKRSGVFRMT